MYPAGPDGALATPSSKYPHTTWIAFATVVVIEGAFIVFALESSAFAALPELGATLYIDDKFGS